MQIRSSRLNSWRQRGRMLTVFGRDLFVTDLGPRDAGSPLLVLHGFPTSSFDFVDVAEELARDRRVILFDFPGFGLSAKPPDYSYSLLEQAESAIEVWRQLGCARGHILAHDYGTSVATELLARRARRLLPIEIDSLTLCNGSVHIELAHLTASQKLLRNRVVGPIFARLSSRRFAAARLRALFEEPARLSDDVLDGMWEGMIAGGGRERLSDLAQYMRERVRFWHRWIGALRDFDRPAHILWGRSDPIAVPAIAERLTGEIPSCQLTWLDRVGHYPMVEAPADFATAARGFLARHDRPPG
jgi:pimeloyl-ACP methyl ester carboxylesterase